MVGEVFVECTEKTGFPILNFFGRAKLEHGAANRRLPGE
jgi:hypothetical protein